MCNPRRVTTTLTRDLAEAWRREVTRTVAHRELVRGEARIRQPLEASIGAPALRALQLALAAEDSGWQPVEEGYRRNVEGGYVVYRIDERVLEIVAVLEDQVEAQGKASELLEGEVREQISARGESTVYDDGYGGWTEERGQQESRRIAEEGLERARRERLERAQREAEESRAAELEARADAAGRAELERLTQERRADLDRQAQQRLEAVGLRGRQVFYTVLGQAYRDAILAYVRSHGAQDISCREEGNTFQIEFLVER
jgi:hypothetical protein